MEDQEQITEEKDTSCKSLLKTKVFPFLYKHFLVIGILVALFIGFVLPHAGALVGRFKGSSYICVIMIFLHSGLKLKTAELRSVAKEYKPFLWGVISITLLSSVIGTKLSQLLPFDEDVSNCENYRNRSGKTSIVGPKEFLIGFEFYYISPCAIASGIVLTTLAGGDVTLALLLTVTTNTVGVLAVPLLAKWLVSVGDVQINVPSLLVKLTATLLVPLLIGKALTYYFSIVKEFVEKQSKSLKIISIIFFICIPWIKISTAKMNGSFNNVSLLSLVIMVAWGFAMHFLFLVMNYVATWMLRFKLEVRKTLVIMSSTKTLAVTLSIISFLPPEFGSPGVMSLPLIISHLSLLLVDSFWVVHWNSKEQESKEEEEHPLDSTGDNNEDLKIKDEEYSNSTP